MWFIIITSVLLVLFFGSYSIKPKKEDYDDNVPRGALFAWRLAIGAITVLYVGFSVIMIVPAGSVKVATFFGSVQPSPFYQGINVVNPFYDFHTMSVRQQVITFKAGGNQSDDNVSAAASDNLVLTIDVTYAFKINPRFAPWLYQNVGDEDTVRNQLIEPAAAAGTRAATAKFNYQQATTSQRDQVALSMESSFHQRLVENLVGQGLSKAEAEQVFIFLPTQLRKVLPPEKVQNSISEKAAAEQDLQRQVILTQIATQEAQRRAQEGMGVKMLFGQLPTGFTSAQISEVLIALANKERADAMRKAVESGKVNVMVMEGNSQAVSVQGK